MASRQRVLLSKDVIDLVGKQSKVTGESIASIIEGLILYSIKTNWLKESYSCDCEKEREGDRIL